MSRMKDRYIDIVTAAFGNSPISDVAKQFLLDALIDLYIDQQTEHEVSRGAFHLLKQHGLVTGNRSTHALTRKGLDIIGQMDISYSIEF